MLSGSMPSWKTFAERVDLPVLDRSGDRIWRRTASVPQDVSIQPTRRSSMRIPRPAVRAAISLSLVVVLGTALGATMPAQATKGGSGSSTGTGRVFMVNPVQSSGDQTLTDQNDSATAVPASDYRDMQLRNLDGSGYLRGAWVTVESATGTPAFSTT